MTKAMGRGDLLLLLGLSVLWGGSFIFNRVAVREVSVLTIVAARVVIAAVLLTLLVRLRGLGLPRGARNWSAIAVTALFSSALPFALIVWAQRSITSGEAAILNASTPIFTILLAHLLTQDERMTRAKLVGVLLGFAGVAVMVGPAALSGQGHWTAQLLSLTAALSYGLGAILARRVLPAQTSPLITAAALMIAASAMLLPVALLADRPWQLPLPGPAVSGAVLALGALSTALAYLIYYRLLASIGAVNLSTVTLLSPVSAVLMGWLVLGEVLGLRQLAGMALIALGLLAIDGRAWRALRGH